MSNYTAPWYLRALAWVAPQRAATQIHLDRLARDETYREAVGLGLRLRGYKSAESKLGITPWTSQGTPRSADTEVLFDLPKLRERSRETRRNDPIGSGLISNFVNDVVGTGHVAQSTANSREELEAYWDTVKDGLCPADRLDWCEVQRLLYGKLLEDGEVFLNRVVQGGELWFEVVEADRVRWPQDIRPAKGTIRDGVERDERGRIIAYWVAKRHPGDVHLPWTAGDLPRPIALASVDFDRVKAENIYHLKLTERPGQSRGVPFLAPVLQNLRDLDLLLEAALKRTQIAACLAAFITSEQTVPDLLEVTAEDYGYELDQRITPGMIFKLFPGESVTSFSPPGEFPNLDSFVIMLARRIGAALGVSWQLVLKDFSTANYSSARSDLLEARKVFRAHQAKLIGCLRWVWVEVLEFAHLRGEIRVNRDDIRKVRFQPPGWEWVDPEKEARAAELELKIGLTTLRDLAASRGRDWEDLMAQQAVEKERREELGL